MQQPVLKQEAAPRSSRAVVTDLIANARAATERFQKAHASAAEQLAERWSESMAATPQAMAAIPQATVDLSAGKRGGDVEHFYSEYGPQSKRDDSNNMGSGLVDVSSSGAKPRLDLSQTLQDRVSAFQNKLN